MAGFGWLMAGLCSLPMLGVFRVNTSGDVTKCENIFRDRPNWHRQIWVTYICFSVFFIPLFILVCCYSRIFLKVAQKANENTNKKPLRFKTQTGKVYLQSTHSTALPKAKIKTLKLTCVIIVVFVVCTAPYFIVEMIMSFGDHCLISEVLYGLLGGMAACNSAANPFIFLAFNITLAWLKEVKQRFLKSRIKRPRFVYSATSSMVESNPSIKHFGNVHSTQTSLNS